MNDPADEGPGPSRFPRGSIIQPRIVFSPDGRMLAMNRWQKTIPVWEAATGKERLRLEGHQDSTVCVAFSRDGRTLASASWDNTIRLWDLTTGKELRRLTGHRGKANSLAFAADGKTLISAGDDTTILFWDVAAITCRQRPEVRLAPAEWETLWADLADGDAAKAHQAIAKLTAAPQTVSKLKHQLRPAAAPPAELLGRLLRDLDDEKFAAREKASQELERLGQLARPAIEKALAGSAASLELRRRLEHLLKQLQVPSGERLRELRAVEVLEHIGTPKAQALLRDLANGAPDARLTQEAKATLDRLAKRSAAAP